MTVDDLEGVLEIERVSFPSPWPRSQFERELKNPLSYAFTAKVASPSPISLSPEGREEGEGEGEGLRIIGYVIFWLVGDEAHILNIAVHPGFRRRGIAKALLSFTLELLLKKGGKGVFLEVRRSNLAARRLYKGFGFKEIGVRKGYYTDNQEDAIVMGLELLVPYK